MTYDEVKALARRVGFDTENETGMTCLELFAMDVAKTEREACAKVCEDNDHLANASHLAEMIRMRSNSELMGRPLNEQNKE